ncbi:hypothetical protein HYALB_00010280 [Hymenoscyphus albidus]|uniref:NmrA-like domain-containing protein n=1 Tax=Hymenoscyphus albidus TaxID=595503 RepID=A0A9N9LRT2_9HELO|nr:hypothetical protein HYALB_00010280 [Hymenoscyphus albidus]
MHVFITGATGFVGTSVVQALHKSGHTVLGLVRSPQSAQKLQATGAKALHGTLEDLEILQQGAKECDGVIHLGFVHELMSSDFEKACAIDATATETIGHALEGTGKPFVYTSGLLGIRSDGVLATEGDERQGGGAFHPRVKTESKVLGFAAKGVRAMVIRLPPSTHGEGDKGFVPMLTKVAQEKGVSGYIGGGTNAWPSCHRSDAAVLYKLALEKGVAGGVHHAVHDQAVPTKDIAGVIGRKLGVPVVSIAQQEAAGHFGFMAWPLGMNAPTSGEKTQKELGWLPVDSKLMEDLESGSYF